MDINYIKNLNMIKQLFEDKTEDKINKIIKHIADKEEIGLIKNKSS